MYRIFTWTFMSYVPIFATACFHNVKPQFQKLFCSNWFRFHVGKSLSQFDTKRQAVHVEPITGVQHSALASICLRLFMFMFLNPFSLYNKAVTSICCLSFPAKLPATQSSEVILPNGNLIQLTRCRVFFPLKKNIL